MTGHTGHTGQAGAGSSASSAAPVAGVRRPPGIKALVSGAYLDPEQAARAERCLVVALQHASGQVDALADRLAELQAAGGDLMPIVVVRSSSTRRLRFHGFLYERVMPPLHWERVASRDTYPQYLSTRLDSIRGMYRPHIEVDLPGGAELTAQLLDRARGLAGRPRQAESGEGR